MEFQGKLGSHSQVSISLHHLCNLLPPRAAARSCFLIQARSNAPQKCSPMRRGRGKKLIRAHAKTSTEKKGGQPAVQLTSLPFRGTGLLLRNVCVSIFEWDWMCSPWFPGNVLPGLHCCHLQPSSLVFRKWTAAQFY